MGAATLSYVLMIVIVVAAVSNQGAITFVATSHLPPGKNNENTFWGAYFKIYSLEYNGADEFENENAYFGLGRCREVFEIVKSNFERNQQLFISEGFLFFVGICLNILSSFLSAIGDVLIRYSFLLSNDEVHLDKTNDECSSSEDICDDQHPLQSFANVCVDPSSLSMKRHCETNNCFPRGLRDVLTLPTVDSTALTHSKSTNYNGRTDWIGLSRGALPELVDPDIEASVSISDLSCYFENDVPEDTPSSWCRTLFDMRRCCFSFFCSDFLLLGIFFSSVLSPFLSILAILCLPASMTGFGGLQIFFVLLLSKFFLKEEVASFNLIGGAFVIIGLTLLSVTVYTDSSIIDLNAFIGGFLKIKSLAFIISCILVGLTGILLLRFNPHSWKIDSCDHLDEIEGIRMRIVEKGNMNGKKGKNTSAMLDRDLESSICVHKLISQEQKELRVQLCDNCSPLVTLEVEDSFSSSASSSSCVSSNTFQHVEKSEVLLYPFGEISEEPFPNTNEKKGSQISLKFFSLPTLHKILLPCSAGIFGSYAVLCVKAFEFSVALTLPSTSSGGFNFVQVFFAHPFIFLFLVFALVCAILELLFLSKCLQFYPALASIPIMNACLTVVTAIGGTIFFDQSPTMPLIWIGGMGFIVGGVAFLVNGSKIYHLICSFGVQTN